MRPRQRVSPNELMIITGRKKSMIAMENKKQRTKVVVVEVASVVLFMIFRPLWLYGGAGR